MNEGLPLPHVPVCLELAQGVHRLELHIVFVHLNEGKCQISMA